MALKHEATIAELKAENTALRAIVAKVECVYGYRDPESGACKLGYPGCACADDIAALTFDCDGAVERIKARQWDVIK
jgi:hypothetical protein